MKPCAQTVLTEAINTALDCYNMGREERGRIKLPVCFSHSAGELKLQSAYTVDISTSGVRLDGLKTPLDLGEVLEIECSNRSAPYRVVWSGARGTATEGQAGLECLAADADIWKLDLSQLSDGEALERARVVQRRLLPQ